MTKGVGQRVGANTWDTQQHLDLPWLVMGRVETQSSRTVWGRGWGWERGQDTLKLSQPGFDLCTDVPVMVFLCRLYRSPFEMHRVTSWGLLWPVGAAFPRRCGC